MVLIYNICLILNLKDQKKEKERMGGEKTRGRSWGNGWIKVDKVFSLPTKLLSLVYNPRIWENTASWTLGIPDQPGLLSETVSKEGTHLHVYCSPEQVSHWHSSCHCSKKKKKKFLDSFSPSPHYLGSLNQAYNPRTPAAGGLPGVIG